MARQQRKAYAKIFWNVEDVQEEADRSEVSLTQGEARRLLLSIERHIEDAMVAAGWQVVQRALEDPGFYQKWNASRNRARAGKV